MRITADTNVLVRAITGDDAQQSPIAQNALADADAVAVTLPTLCEFVWVLRRGYRVSTADIAEAIRRLIGGGNVLADRPAIEAGLSALDADGDFADAVIAYEGRWLGAEIFASFDVKAVSMLRDQGEKAVALG
ncbi:type II toxin-antitoxin system VapC family toxin [soil metagenome]